MKNILKRFQSLNDMFNYIINDDKTSNDLKQILYYRINNFLQNCNTMKYEFNIMNCDIFVNDNNMRMYEINYSCKINNVTHEFISLYDNEFVLFDDKMIF